MSTYREERRRWKALVKETFRCANPFWCTWKEAVLVSSLILGVILLFILFTLGRNDRFEVAFVAGQLGGGTGFIFPRRRDIGDRIGFCRLTTQRPGLLPYTTPLSNEGVEEDRSRSGGGVGTFASQLIGMGCHGILFICTVSRGAHHPGMGVSRTACFCPSRGDCLAFDLPEASSQEHSSTRASGNA